MVGYMYSKGKFNELINSYGMVIVDECHHVASNTSMDLLQKINAKYVYGVSATPKRGDSLDKIIYMLLGPLRNRFSALERAQEQGIGHYFVPRYTRVVDTVDSKDDINKAYSLISNKLVWYGGMNLRGKVDCWDNLMRIKEQQVAAELLEIALGVTSE